VVGAVLIGWLVGGRCVWWVQKSTYFVTGQWSCDLPQGQDLSNILLCPQTDAESQELLPTGRFFFAEVCADLQIAVVNF